MNQALAQSFGLKKPAGALISAVEAGSPADRSGMKSGDVILAVDGTRIQTASESPPMIASLKPGATALLEVWRTGEEKKVKVRLGELLQEAAAPAERHAQGGRLGLAVRPLTPEERRQSGLQGGLLVVEVGGPAARAGIRDGDVILALNGTPVGNVETLRTLAEHAGKHMALLIQREDAKLFVPITLG